MGSGRMERPPMSMISSAMTTAKIGRVMKNLAMASVRPLSRLGDDGLRGRLHHRSWLDLLHAGDDHPIAVGEAAFDDPLAAARSLELQRAHGNLVVGADDQRRGPALWVMRDADLRHEHGVVDHALFDARTHEHPGKQD